MLEVFFAIKVDTRYENAPPFTFPLKSIQYHAQFISFFLWLLKCSQK